MPKAPFAVRSFVRREGRFTKGQQIALKKYWPVYGINTKDRQLNFQDLFRNSQPVILDIGFGNGDALCSLALQHSHLNFLGVEVYRPGIGALLRKLFEAQINNVRVANIDAVDLLQECVASKSLTSILIWFPDPWPKKRHHKRRLIQADFVELASSKLVDEGELNIATDWQPYAEHIEHVLQQGNLFTAIDASNFITQRPKTKFECRGEKLGHQVFSQIYKKLK